MGSGCSRVQNARRTFTESVTDLKPQENGREAPPKQKSLEESREEVKEDEDEDLDALSPISAITKVGSARTRGMSAASTVLPGTSISLSPALEDLAELQSYKPLPELTEFSEETRNLLLGRCPAQSLSENRTMAEIPFLVLCNGDDAYGFFEEVQKVVMPTLKELCFRADATFSVYVFGHQSIPCGSDFRHLIVHFARDLLKSHRLVTMTIYGRSSVRLQPPDIILQSDFDAAVARTSSAEHRELIHCLYSADVNAVKPCYRLSNRARSADDWPRHQDRIMRVLELALDDGDKDVYLTTVFEDILCTLLDSTNQHSRRRSFLIHLEHSAQVDERPRREDVRVQHLLSNWEDIIPDDHKFNFFDGDSWQELDSQGDGTPAAFGGLQIKLLQLFEKMLEEFEQDLWAIHDIDMQLREELIHQENEIQTHLKSFQDRPELLSSLMNYIAGPQSHPLVVHGRQGRGKSALLAVSTVLSGAVFPAMPVLFRSACVSPESFTQEQILRSVCEQLSVLYGEHSSLASRSIAEHNSYFSSLLRRARAERPLVIILDGLDQVEEYSGRSLKWFPVVLPQHVKLILGLRDGTSELQELQERLLGEKSAFLEVPDMETEETLSVIRNQMRSMGRRLTENQINFVRICVTDNAYPRYAHVFAHVACTWNSLSVPEHFWARHSMADIFGDYLTHLSSTVSLRVVRYFLAILGTAKHGLMQSEILELLQKKMMMNEEGCCEEMNGLSGDPVLSVFLCRNLSFILRTCYRSRHAFVQFGCQLFRKLCKSLVGSQQLGSCLKDVFEYFQGGSEGPESVQYRTSNENLKTNHKHQRWRSLEEVTHLRIRLNLPVRRNFFDHQWMYDRVSLGGDPYLLLEEIKMYKRRNPDDREFELLRKFLQLSAYALRHDGRQLFAQLYGRMRGYYVEPGNSVRYPNVKSLYKTSATPPVPTFLSQGPCLRTLVDVQRPGVVETPTTSSSESELFDDIMWLDTDGRYLVTYSGSKGEVTAWNVVQMKRMTSLTDMPNVDGMLSMHNNAEILLLHHGRLEVYDLAKGILKVQMVELIDAHQGAKVLAGGKYVLAVSAGHDEILRFETHTGHVVHRIMADCKRRLDRLLVSEEGELCVCGDSVNKPYPLLVWSLHGEMLHHFSKPHHEYAIRHTRISGDGTMLFSVAKDLLGSSPNFLVAYDLLTGNTAWQTQAESSLSALDLCRATQTLVAATDKGFLYCWNSRNGEQSFKKSIPLHHRIDKLVTTPEKSFLTWDSRSKDRCLRLWNTTDGTSLATFTADFDIACCTVSRDGKSIGLVLSGKDIPAAIKLRTASQQISSPEDASVNNDACD